MAIANQVRILLAIITSFFGQAPASAPEVATIMAVKPHNGASDEHRYDVSLKVNDTSYVILYTPPNGSTGVEYALGQNLLVTIGDNSMVFTKFGRTFEVPILSRQSQPTDRKLDWSQAAGSYFSQKLEHLSDALDLTAEQQAKIQPVLEQEAGEARYIIGNPVFPRKEKLSRFERVVRDSDNKMKSVLSDDQWRRLQALRREQRSGLKDLLKSKPASD